MTRRIFQILTAIAVVGAVGCSAQADVEKVPVGTDVQLTREDGGVVQGKLTEKDATSVKVVSGKTTKVVPREQIADVRIVEPNKPVELPAIAKFREYVVPEDTALNLTMDTAVSSETAQVEDSVGAKLSEAIMVDGVEVVPAGSTVRGNVSAAQSAGKVKGRASLGLHFTTLVVRGEQHAISARWAAEAASTKKDDAKKIGIGAGAGAIIGGILGGKKGAATGAAVGGGAGTAVVLATEGKPVALATGAALTVRLARSLEVKVPVR